MKKQLAILLALLLLLTALSGCGDDAPAQTEPAETEAALEETEAAPAETEEAPAEPEDTRITVDDGRARPSACGTLQVVNGKLCGQDGEPVMLRGVSFNGLVTSESFLSEATFRELAEDDGVNLVRLAMYTYGVGSVGYCTNGDKERHKQDIAAGVELASGHDMYVLIDWHILSDGDPNLYADEAEAFFAEMAALYADYDNVLYEICNEPNGVDWPTVKRYAERIIPVIREKDPDSVVIVGNPDWSKDLDSVAADPLDFDNVLYTLHFYSATHGQEVRDMTERVSRNGLPIFVSEFGVTASTGGFPRDLDSADAWIELLERENISYCLWAFSKAPEACSVLRSNTLGYSGFTEANYTETGLWLMKTLAEHSTR